MIEDARTFVDTVLDNCTNAILMGCLAGKSGRFIRTRSTTCELPPSARCITGPMGEVARNGVHHPSGVWFDEPVEEISIASEDLDIALTLLHMGPAPDRCWIREEEWRLALSR